MGHSRLVTDSAKPAPPQLEGSLLEGYQALAPWPKASKCLLACSGGADSTFLAWTWLEFAQMAGLEGMAIVVDHGSRSGSAADAADAVARLLDMGIHAEVRTLQNAARNENQMRNARYGILAQVAEEYGADFLLMAHHADDSAETVLLRIMRGTGLRGLAGIPTRRDFQLPNPSGEGEGRTIEIRRPLLSLRASDIRERLKEGAVPWTEDPTNQDPSYAARNRLRKNVLPVLETIATGDPIKALLRLSTEAADWKDAQEELLKNAPDIDQLPLYLRQQAYANELRARGEKVTLARIRNPTLFTDKKGPDSIGH